MGGVSASEDDNEGKVLLIAKQISKSMQDSMKELRETKKSMDALAEKVRVFYFLSIFNENFFLFLFPKTHLSFKNKTSV